MCEKLTLAALSSEVFTGDEIQAHLPGYSVRESQVAMSSAVADLVELGGISVLEAGTGVGKSLAYLVPAVLSEQACVVSTATITLQDQLAGKDIPTLARILGRKIDTAVLKGRGNYLCLRKWTLWGQRIPGAESVVESAADGDLSTVKAQINPGDLRKISGDAMDCLGSRCPSFHQCYYYRARNRARKASILIVNHHLLLCGLESGDLIPEAWFLVVDEAHSLHSAASATMGYLLGTSHLNGVLDALALSQITIKEKTEFLAAVREISSCIEKVSSSGNQDGEVEIADIEEDLQRIADSCGDLRKQLAVFDDLSGACQALSAVEKTSLGICQTRGSSWCCYTEKHGRNPVLKAVPVNPGHMLRERLYGSFPAVLLTSATLASAGSFSYYDALLGVPEEAERRIFQSPFDFGKQAVLALPEHSTKHDDHRKLAETAWKMASEAASILGGRTMILFTSYRNLELCVETAAIKPLDGIPVLAQGKMTRTEILEKFRENPEAVIMGTSSFWEGIDLPGELLNALFIDRIPFPSPGHPLNKSRMEYCEEQGKSSFTSVMIPEAATRLRQGVGRLVRSVNDKGAVFILDTRLITARYAPLLLKALPGFRRTSVPDAMEFLREHSPRERGNTIEGSSGGHEQT